MRVLLPLLLAAPASALFNLSNTLGDTMVLQRAPASAVVWGFAPPGTAVTATLQGKALPPVKADENSTWRVALPPQPATLAPQTITLSDGATQLALKDVLFGDVILCGGQSNMQYTPLSIAGMNNKSAELAAADGYGRSIRFFTVGMETDCGKTDCKTPFRELNHAPGIRTNISAACAGGRSCREGWAKASAAALGKAAWDTFSGVCWLTGRDIHDALGGKVPIGLISSNWGGTPVQSWEPYTGTLYNSMIAPFAVGPMQLKGATWYQGEANVGGAAFYATAFPAMVTGWREVFKQPSLWFGFVQIAGWKYSAPSVFRPHHSQAAGDLRQAQLAALALDNVGFSTAIDTGDWNNIHPPDKQNPSARLARQALVQAYGMGPVTAADEFPVYMGSSAGVSEEGFAVVKVNIRGSISGKPLKLTDKAPIAATQSTTLGKSTSVPRNVCVDSLLSGPLPCDCGWPAVYATFPNGTEVQLNATAAIGADGSSVVLTAMEKAEGATPVASAYGRASWPMTLFFAEEGGNPVIPWYSNFTNTKPWVWPGSPAADWEPVPAVKAVAAAYGW